MPLPVQPLGYPHRQTILFLDTDIIFVFFQLFGAKKLADWCKWYITGNYQEVLKDHGETLDALSEELQLELLNSMWPPEW